MFDIMNPFQYLSWNENDIDSKVIDFVNDRKYRVTTKHDIDEFLAENNLNYYELSVYSKNLLDTLDI